MPPIVMNTADEQPYVTTGSDPFQSIYRIDLPAPSKYRGADGMPGPDYWQQRADYGIAAVLDTTARKIMGAVTIRYTNNSPDTLTYLWLQLDQNLYAPGSKGSALFPADSRWGVRGFKGGYTLNDVKVNGLSTQPRVHDTMMRLDLRTPIPPYGGVAMITMSFNFNIPDHGSDRMGRDGALYEIAQWYPRMAVYDDVRGWNTDPYLGQGEFYLEYGDIDYSVTVPAGYLVAGSGMLSNPTDVLTQIQRDRLARTQKDTGVVQIVTATEAAAKVRQNISGTKTWRFSAKNVRDVAWAAAPDFRWDATSWNGILCQAYYQFSKSGKAWESAAEQTRWSIKTYSELFFPYPYPQATSVAGPVGGMEYPMFVMVHTGTEDPNSIFGTLDHEQGHQWFPMIVGSNERRYAWQDEGFNTYINAFSGERRYANDTTRLFAIYNKFIGNWRDIHNRGMDSPLMTAPDNIDPAALGAIGYRKPGMVLMSLRNYVVGKELFDDAFRAYTKAWGFKHPTPADFFRTIENQTGEDLSWFWRSFFYTTDVLDIGIENVRNDSVNDDRGATVILKRHTSIVFPVIMRVKYSDGSTEDVKLPVNIWSAGNTFAASVPAKGRRNPVTGVRLWPQFGVPDWNPTNDAWGDAPVKESQGPISY